MQVQGHTHKAVRHIVEIPKRSGLRRMSILPHLVNLAFPGNALAQSRNDQPDVSPHALLLVLHALLVLLSRVQPPARHAQPRLAYIREDLVPDFLEPFALLVFLRLGRLWLLAVGGVGVEAPRGGYVWRGPDGLPFYVVYPYPDGLVVIYV